MKIRSIASVLLSVALGLNSCTQQNTEVKVGSSPSTSADTDVKINSWPSTLSHSKLFLFTRNSKYGYIDRTGKVVVSAKLDAPYENSNSATSARDELIVLEEKKQFYEFAKILGLAYSKSTYGYINDRTRKVVIRPQFSQVANRFSEGLAWIRMDEDGRRGYIDKTGKIVIPLQYSKVGDFNNGLAKVCSMGKSPKCGYIDRTGEVIIPLKFDEAAEKFNSGLAWVKIENRLGYIDKTGEIVIPLQYDRADDFDGDLAEVCSEGGWQKCGSIDRTGKVVIPLKFDRVAEKFSNGLAWVEIENRLGYIDKTSEIVIPLQYDRAGDFDDGLARVCSEGESPKCGYIDRTGKVVIPLKFDEAAEKFSNGLAWVVIENRLGYIDKTGTVKIPTKFNTPYPELLPRYDEATVNMCTDGQCVEGSFNFDRGLALVMLPETCKSSDRNDCDRSGYIDTTGKLIFEF